jgi:CRP-like cAMP-binding protein
MIAEDYLRRIAIWSRELDAREIEVARAGVVERSYAAGESIFHRGDHFDYWTGVISGLARMGIVSREGKTTSFTGLTAGAGSARAPCSRRRRGAMTWWRCATRGLH